jgi:ankyrin repeat protein
MRRLAWLLLLVLVISSLTGAQPDDELEDEAEWEDSPMTTQLWHLVSSNNVDGLNLFVAQNPHWVHLRSADGRGALFWAYEYGRPQLISKFLNAGVDPKAKDRSGSTPADLAPSGFTFTHNPTLKFEPPPSQDDEEEHPAYDYGDVEDDDEF